jgi:hypothetical protein
MKWGTRLVAAVMAVSLAGCASEPSSGASDETEMELLVQRTFALQKNVGTAGRMTAELRSELTVLASDVEAWQQRTGRSDISVSRSRPAREEGVAARPISPVAPGGCTPCPLISLSEGKVCFLIEESPCRDDIIAKVCAYICLSTPAIRRS